MKPTLLFLLFTTLLMSMPSCVKEDDTIAIVTVVDNSGARIPDAQVILYGNPQPVLGTVNRVDSNFTDQNGQATFNYTEIFKLGQAGFATLDIKATKGQLEGSGIIKIVEETTSTKTVTIQP
jgi:hypothetical protein